MRITNKDIARLINKLNLITNNPAVSWKSEGSNNTVQIGNYHAYGAYGGVGLHQVTAGGGVDTIKSIGTKKELYNFLQAFISGIETK